MKASSLLNQHCIEVIERCGGMAWRNNSGKINVGGRWIRLAPKGSGDVLGLLRGVFVSIETKVDDQPSADQLAWQQTIIDNGGRALIVRDVQAVIDLCNEIMAQT